MLSLLTMNITVWGILLGLLLAVVPWWLLHTMQSRLTSKVLHAIGRMVLELAILGLCLYFVMQWKHWAVNIGCLLLMTATGILTTLHEAQKSWQSYWIPIGIGMLTATIVVGAWLLLLAMGISHPLETRYLIPVAGLLLGSIAHPMGQALATYHAGLLHHDRLYYYLLGNGSTHGEALAWFERRAIERATLHWTHRMSSLVLVSSPMVVWAMLLGGCSVIESIVTLLLMVVAGFSATVLALFICLRVARRYAFDSYSRLKDKNET